MRFTLAILAAALPIPALAQPGSATANGMCSLANTGSSVSNVTIHCGIGQEQGQKMLAVLNKILANQLDFAVVMGKLDEIEAAQKAATQSTNVNCPNNAGNCAGVNNGQQVIQYGPVPFSLSGEQVKTASAELAKKSPPHSYVQIEWEWSAPDGKQAATQLHDVLLAAGVNVLPVGAGCGMCINYPGAPSYSGISFATAGSPDLNNLADDIEAALKASGATSDPIRRDDTVTTGNNSLVIYIRKP